MAEFTERELTYAVSADWRMPELAPVVPEAGSVESDEVQLDATYHDTGDHLLGSLGITLRRRTGGHDAGWHLKVPTEGARTEMQSGSRLRTPPPALVERLSGLRAGRPLAPVATIRTSRRIRRVLDGSGALVAEIADDAVVGVPASDQLGDPPTAVAWREVEVELGPAGDEDALARIGGLLVDAGAVERGTTMKLAEVLDVAPPPVHDDLAAYVRVQCAQILLGEVRLRGESDAETVHDTRVAVRRLRSSLRMFAPLLREDLGEWDEELRWFSLLLGGMRDADVLRRQLREEMDALPPELVLGPVRTDLGEALERGRARAERAWRSAWRDERYARLLGAVSEWYHAPPVGEITRKVLREEGGRILGVAERTVRTRLAKAGDSPEDLHHTRKAAKRMRYTAEALQPVLKGAQKKVRRAKALQTVLGDHQDLIVRQEFLVHEASSWGAREGHQTFTLGLLHARAAQEAAQLRAGSLSL